MKTKKDEGAFGKTKNRPFGPMPFGHACGAASSLPLRGRRRKDEEEPFGQGLRPMPAALEQMVLSPRNRGRVGDFNRFQTFRSDFDGLCSYFMFLQHVQ